MKEKKLKIAVRAVLFLFVFMCFSCVSTKNITYFQDLNESNKSELNATAKFVEPVIQSDDILAISIVTVDPQTSAMVNQASSQQVVGAASNISRQEITGFLVDKNNDIELAVIGKVKVGGLTTFEATELIKQKASKDFRDPTVNVRFANFKVSVLGEVNRPASYNLPNEKVSVLDVISLAGDLTLYGKRENVLVIREKNGKKELGRLNLNSSGIFSSPFYYLKQNDIIYVEQSKAKVSSLNAPTRANVGIILSAISVLVLAFTRVF